MAAYIGAHTRSTTPGSPAAMLSFGTRKIGDLAATPKMVITEEGNVGIGKINPGSKLDVVSDTTTAIVGTSSSGAGVYGESTQFNGVRGRAHNPDHGAVVGVHNSEGIGVLGQSAGIGVFGKSLDDGAGVYGESAQFNGVRGLAHNANHGGVVGVHDGGGIAVYGTGAVGVQGDGTSVGVYGRSASGAAVHAEGNATQAPNKGGFVKAMVEVNSFGRLQGCYNGVTGSSTDGCGITTALLGKGVYRITFPFSIAGRFVSITVEYDANTDPADSVHNRGANYRFYSERTIEVFTFKADDPDDTSSSNFMLIVF